MTPQPQQDRTLKWEPYWITPPELYKKLDDEFHFNYDPCPFPKPKDYNGIDAEWGTSNYVNPPFHPENGIGPTAFVRKAIEENKKGKTVVLTIPTQSYVNLLLEAGAELRSLGRVKWLHTVTREPMKGPSPITAFILRSRPAPSTPNNIITCIESCERTETRLVDFCRVCESKKTCGVLILAKYLKQHDTTIRKDERERVLDEIFGYISTKGVEKRPEGYYVVFGRFSLADMLEYLESLRSKECE